MHRLPFALALALCGCEARQPAATKTHDLARAGPVIAPMPTDVETKLRGCIGKTVAETVETLGLTGGELDGEPRMVDEPPGVLRGVRYHDDRDRSVRLYFAETAPLYRKFSEFGKWDATLIPKCRVGGIQYSSGESHFDIGPAVPWQWRRPTTD